MSAVVVDDLARRSVFAGLERLTGGRVTVVEPGAGRRGPNAKVGTRHFGDLSADRYGRVALKATVHVHEPATYRRVLRHGTTGLGESYADGWWDADDLTALLRVLGRNLRRTDPVVGPLRRFATRATDPVRRRRRQDPTRDRDDVRAHYDLGNDFFERLLDETMMYSSAIFPAPSSSLVEGSVHKLDRLCRRLGLGPDDHVLEIGTGWGGFALDAARHHGCRVTTTTVSRQQYEYARSRVRAAGLDDRITVLDRDYRDLDGEFDAVVSIEMIEAVDWREYETFFSICRDRLAPAGRVGMQAIVIPGQRFDQARSGRDFIKKVIFPGGCLPSIEALLAASGTASDLVLTDLEDIGLHYGETLRRWRANLEDCRADLGDLGLDPRFGRLWAFYLSYCEAGFDERDISAVQLVLTRPGCDLSGLVARQEGLVEQAVHPA